MPYVALKLKIKTLNRTGCDLGNMKLMVKVRIMMTTNASVYWVPILCTVQYLAVYLYSVSSEQLYKGGTTIPHITDGEIIHLFRKTSIDYFLFAEMSQMSYIEGE